MLISRRAGYAIHGLAYLSTIQPGRQIYFNDICKALRGIAKDLSLSKSYVARIFYDLSRSGFVKASKGVGGGYCLLKPADQIFLIDIISSIDGQLTAEHCPLCKKGCNKQPACSLYKVMENAHSILLSYFRKKTISDIAEELIF